MPSAKPLTKKDLVDSLKNLPTKNDVRQIVKDEVFGQMSKFHANLTKPALAKLEKRLNKRFDKVDKRLDKVESEVIFVKRDVKDIKQELGTTPPLKQFEELKRKVDRYHPTTLP